MFRRFRCWCTGVTKYPTIQDAPPATVLYVFFGRSWSFWVIFSLFGHFVNCNWFSLLKRKSCQEHDALCPCFNISFYVQLCYVYYYLGYRYQRKKEKRPAKSKHHLRSKARELKLKFGAKCVRFTSSCFGCTGSLQTAPVWYSWCGWEILVKYYEEVSTERPTREA